MKSLALPATLSYLLTAAAVCPAAEDPGGIPFSGTIDVGFYAIDAGVFSKAPDTLLADPAKLLAFFSRSSKDGKAREILHSEVKIQNGKGELQNIKREIFNIGFLWEGDGVVPNPNQRNEYHSGLSLEIKSAVEEPGGVKLQHAFDWVPKIEVRAITRQYGLPQRQFSQCISQAAVPKGGTVLAAEWRSETPPPDCKPGTQWQYLLFYTLK